MEISNIDVELKRENQKIYMAFHDAIELLMKEKRPFDNMWY